MSVAKVTTHINREGVCEGDRMNGEPQSDAGIASKANLVDEDMIASVLRALIDREVPKNLDPHTTVELCRNIVNAFAGDKPPRTCTSYTSSLSTTSCTCQCCAGSPRGPRTVDRRRAPGGHDFNDTDGSKRS